MKPRLSRQKLDRQLVQPSIQDIATAFLMPSDSRSHLTFAMTPILPIRINTSPGTGQAVILQLPRTSPSNSMRPTPCRLASWPKR